MHHRLILAISIFLTSLAPHLIGTSVPAVIAQVQRGEAAEAAPNERTTVVVEMIDGGGRVERSYLGSLLHGKQLFISKSGTPMAVNFYDRGKKTGTWQWWDGHGQLVREASYLDDDWHGMVRTWHPNGKMRTETRYVKGRKHGRERVWHLNGNLKRVSLYRKNEKDGDQRLFDEDGALIEQSEWSNSWRNGITRYYFKNGRVRREERYKMGVLHGKALRYFESGTLAEKMYYIDGALSGERVSWDPNGTLLKVERLTADDRSEEPASPRPAASDVPEE